MTRAGGKKGKRKKSASLSDVMHCSGILLPPMISIADGSAIGVFSAGLFLLLEGALAG